jgi:hypothetical protein
MFSWRTERMPLYINNTRSTVRTRIVNMKYNTVNVNDRDLKYAKKIYATAQSCRACTREWLCVFFRPTFFCRILIISSFESFDFLNDNVFTNNIYYWNMSCTEIWFSPVIVIVFCTGNLFKTDNYDNNYFCHHLPKDDFQDYYCNSAQTKIISHRLYIIR